MSFGSRSGGGGTGGGPSSAVDVTSIGGAPVAATVKSDAMSNATAVLEVGARDQVYNGVTWDRARGGITAVGAVFTGFQNELPYAIFHAAPVARADGEGGPLEADATGALKVNVIAGGSGAPANVGLTGAAVPASAGYAGFIDAAGNLQGARTYDTNSGAGVENTLGVVLRLSSGAGSVEAGTAANPLAVGDGGASLTVDTPQLPAALVGGRLDENVGAWLGSTAPTVGQKAMAASLPVVIASDQSAIPVLVANTVAVLAAQGAPEGNPALAWGVRLSDGTNFIDGAHPLPTVNSPTASAANTVSLATNFGVSAAISVKGSPGNVFSVSMTNKNPVKRYLQLHDKAAAPAGGDVPLLEFPIAPGGASSVYDSLTLIGTDFFGSEGTHFAVGIAAGFSSTSGTFTAGAFSDTVIQVKYK